METDSRKGLRVLSQSRPALLALAALLPPIVAASWQPHPGFGFAAAAPFAVLSFGKPTLDTLGQSKLDLSQVTVHGDVGVGPYGTVDFQGPSTIAGDLYLDPTLRPQDVISDEGTVTGSRITDQDLSTAVADALDAAANLSGAAPTQSFSNILDSLTVHGSGGLNVIAVGNLDFSASNDGSPLSLVLSGGQDDLFVLNVAGKFDLGPAASISGVDPSRIVVNILSGAVPAQTASKTWVGGTVLAVDRKIALQGGISGPAMGALVSELSLVGGSTVNPETAPAIDLEKWTNGQDADRAPGPLLPIGAQVTWTYQVRNTGNDTLAISQLVDNQLGIIDCAPSLSPGETVFCDLDGVALAGQYTNTATVSAVSTSGITVVDGDPSHYYGAAASGECSDDQVFIADRSYVDGEIVRCVASSFIATEPARLVQVGAGAVVYYEAPLVVLAGGFSVATGGIFVASGPAPPP